MKNEKLKIILFFVVLISQMVFADQSANQTLPSTSNSTSVNNTASSQAQSTTTNSQDTEAINNFFKDADYAHFNEEKGYEFVDSGYFSASKNY